MRARYGLFGCLLFVGAAVASAQIQRGEPRPNSMTFEEGEEGWMLLFYGSSLADWTQSGDAEWRVEDGAIVSDSGGPGLLLTVDRYDNFELTVDFLADPETDSGIFLRTVPEPTDTTRDCYEINIAAPEHDFPTGSLVGRQKVEGVEPWDDWRTLHVEVYGGEVKVRLDGEVILDYEDPEPVSEGYIGLQHNEGRIAFRNVKLRAL